MCVCSATQAGRLAKTLVWRGPPALIENRKLHAAAAASAPPSRTAASALSTCVWGGVCERGA